MSTKIVPFYDIDTDTVIELELSEENAVRAQNDTTFATKILETYLKRQQTTASITVDSPSTDTQTQEEEEATNIDTEDSQSGSLYRWTEACVLLLLENYRASEKKFIDGKQSHKKIWNEIAKIMTEKGHAVMGPQCAAKLRSLKKSNKSVKDHNSKSGNNRRTWQFFEIMDDIFSKKAWCTPVSTRSSTGLSTVLKKAILRTEESNATETDSGCAYDELSTSKGKPTATSLLAKRIRQKEEHEYARNKRHKERMEMDNKLLTLLNKLAEK